LNNRGSHHRQEVIFDLLSFFTTFLNLTGDDITDYYLNWPKFRAALKPKKIKKIDPEWDGFVKQNPELGFEKN